MKYTDYKPVESCQISNLQAIYAGYFGLKSDGVFVEVGAFDGKTYSNTWQLAELGWKGLYIEPVENLWDACVGNHANHPNVSVIRTFVSDVDDKVQDLFAWGDNTFTGNLDFMHYVAKHNVTKVGQAVTMRLYTALEYVGIETNRIDVLVIDVEGHELQVLSDDRVWETYVRPRMVIIETHEYSDDEGLRMHASNINDVMYNHGYIRIYADTINSIFVDALGA